ncbi:MAG: flagellin [Acidisphaera sp.]|nr:flagellin [Acidisphaera sp.]
MSLNSINTNVGATVALESLNVTNAQLNRVQKQVSTGYRVADATDDGAAYAVAQRVRSDVGALNSANQQLGNVQGLVGTTITTLNDVSNLMSSARDVLVKLADGNVVGNERTQYAQQYNSLLTNIKSNLKDATYNSKTLLGNIGGTSGFGAVSVVRNEVGATYGISTFGASALYGSLNASTFTTASGALAAVSTSGTFTKMLNEVGTKLNYYGSVSSYVTNQISFNNDKIDSLNNGLGSLVDADLAKESAQLQSLQIRQQLGEQALSIANQAPSSLLSLFK